jgi:predicted aconitase with swiveling domain
MSERRTRVLVPGTASGEVLALGEPVSFWGGIDAATGTIVDVHHPQRGMCVAGRMLVMPGGRGSSSSASVLAELVRVGAAPAAIVLAESDPILAIGAVVGRALYGKAVPVVRASAEGYTWCQSARAITLTEGGELLAAS